MSLSTLRSIQMLPRIAKHWVSFQPIQKNDSIEVIRRLVRTAYETVPFYREWYGSLGVSPEIRNWSDFFRLPILTKEKFAQVDIQARTRITENPKTLLRTFTSGSSGPALEIAYDEFELARYMVLGAKSYSIGFKWKPWYRQVVVYTSKHPADRILGSYWLKNISTTAPIEEIVEFIRKHHPDFLSIYPSILREVICFLEKKSMSLPPMKAIFTNSEESSQEERDRFSETLRTPVRDEYSSEELNRIAVQCEFKTYHILNRVNFVESIDGRLVGTHLLNTTMPLIRYDQGDHVEITNESCQCGRQTPIMRSFSGRQNDTFCFSNGISIESGRWLDIMYELQLEQRNKILDFRVIQDAKDRVVVEYVPGDANTLLCSHLIENKIRVFLPTGVELEIIAVERIPQTRSGKRARFQALKTC